MKTLLFDTSLSSDVIDEIRTAAFPGCHPAVVIGAGDGSTRVFSVVLSDDAERERFRTVVRATEVRRGLRPEIPPRRRPGMYDLVDSFTPPRHATLGRSFGVRTGN